MRIIDIPYLNITGPDREWEASAPFFRSQQLIIVFFLQCNLRGTTSYTSPSRKNGRPVTSTSCLVPLVTHLQPLSLLLFTPAFLSFSVNVFSSGNIQVSWIDDTSAFVSLSQTDQVQIGEWCTAERRSSVSVLMQRLYPPQRWTPAATQRATGSRRMQSTSRVNGTRRRALRRPEPGGRTGGSLTTPPPAVLDMSGTPVSVNTL